MQANEALVRLSDQARFDPGPFVYRHEESDKELVIDWEKLVEARLTHLVKAVYLTKYGTRIEFHDSQRALELIGKHHKLFTDRVEHTGEIEHTLKGYKQVSPDDWPGDTNKTE